MKWMCFICLAWMIVPLSTLAATYYVDNQLPGSDSNNGTSEATPFLTVQKCLDVMTSGPNTCYVKNGTYTQALRFQYTGSAGNPIVLSAFPGHAPVLQSADRTVSSNQIYIEATAGGNTPISYITISGLEIKNYYYNIHAVNCDHCVFTQLTLHDALHSGILTQGYLITVSRSNIYHNGDFVECASTGVSCNKDHGVYMTGHNTTVVDNIFRNNLGYGVQITSYSYVPATCTSTLYCEGADVVIANNTIALESHRGGVVLSDEGGPLTNAQIVNNIFYKNGDAVPANTGVDMLCGGNLSGALIHDNLWYDPAPGSNTFIAVAGCSTPANYVASNNTNADPVFINVATYDFHLQNTSPAIGTGADMSAYAPTDFDGYSRPQGGSWDTGAYEYIAAGSVSGTIARGAKGLGL